MSDEDVGKVFMWGVIAGAAVALVTMWCVHHVRIEW